MKKIFKLFGLVFGLFFTAVLTISNINVHAAGTYNVKFYDYDGNEITSYAQTVNVGSYPTDPGSYEKESEYFYEYVFLGWYHKDNQSVKYTFNVGMSEGETLSLIAKYKKQMRSDVHAVTIYGEDPTDVNKYRWLYVREGDIIPDLITELLYEDGWDTSNLTYNGYYAVDDEHWSGITFPMGEETYWPVNSTMGSEDLILVFKTSRIEVKYDVELYIDSDTLFSVYEVSEGTTLDSYLKNNYVNEEYLDVVNIFTEGIEKEGFVFTGWKFAIYDDEDKLIASERTFTKDIYINQNVKAIATYRPVANMVTITIHNYYKDGSSAQLVGAEGNYIVLPSEPYVPDGYTWNGKYYVVGTKSAYNQTYLGDSNVDLYVGLIDNETKELVVPTDKLPSTPDYNDKEKLEDVDDEFNFKEFVNNNKIIIIALVSVVAIVGLFVMILSLPEKRRYR